MLMWVTWTRKCELADMFPGLLPLEIPGQVFRNDYCPAISESVPKDVKDLMERYKNWFDYLI